MGKSSSKGQFIKNVGSGWLTVIVTGVVGFVALPLNLKHLGKELYGISALAVSTLTLFSFLRMGMQPALLRFFSHAVAEKNQGDIRSLSSVAQFLLGGLGFVGGLGFLCTYPWFVAIYEVPENVRRDLLILFFAIALDYWSNLFLIPFLTVIQGSNRYDISNIRQCLSKVLGIIVLFAGYSFVTPSLLILAASTFAGTIYQLTSLILLAYKIHGNSIFFHRKSFRWNLLPPLFSFSVWNLINQVFMGLTLQLPLLIIGKTLGVDMVAAFSPAIVLGGFCASILTQISAPLVPIASKDIVENSGKNLGRWAIQMGEITACMGCSIIVVFALLDREIITVWLGESFAWTSAIVTITVMGIVFSGIQATNYRLALGGKFSIAPSALSAVAITVISVLGTFLGTYYGGWSLLGVAAFITFARLLRNTFFLSFTFSRQFGYRFADYTWHVHVKPLLMGLSTIGLFCIFQWLFALLLANFPTLDLSSPLTTGFYSLKWQPAIRLFYVFSLLLSSFSVTCVYLLLCWRFVLQENTRSNMRKLIIKRFVKSKHDAA